MPFDAAPTPFIPYRQPAALPTVPALLLDHALPSPVAPPPTEAKLAAAFDNRRDFTEGVHDLLCRNLERFGNVLNEEHQAALMALVGCLTNLASGVTTGRFAFPLPTGAGKTSAVIAWLTTLYWANADANSGVRAPWSVVVCASRVADLCEIKRQLIELGNVPDEEIGLQHSYAYNSKDDPNKLPKNHALHPATEGNEERRILLLTHAKVRGGAPEVASLMQYRGKTRDLVIWDESLLVGDYRVVDASMIEEGVAVTDIAARKPMASDDLKDAVKWLQAAWAVLDADLQAQIADRRKPQDLKLSKITEADQLRFGDAIQLSRYCGELKTFLRMAQMPVRVVAGSETNKGAYVTYRTVVPTDLKNVAVLDASYPLRKLTQSKSLKLDETFKRHMDFKTYAEVHVNQMFQPGGRKAIEKQANIEKREDRYVLNAFIDVVLNTPLDEAVLSFSFLPKPGRINITAKFKQELKAKGVDLEAKVKTPDGEQPRFQWLTWGQETATNDCGYCKNVLLLGVLHRSEVDLVGAYTAETGGSGNIGGPELRKLVLSECAHAVYQAMSRG